MNIVQRRLALLTGASISILGFAGSAIAENHPGVEHDAGGPNVADTLHITLAGESSQFGTNVSDAPIATAQVGSSASGEIIQLGHASGTAPLGGHLSLVMDNAGTAAISGAAKATGASRVTAGASVTGVHQQGTGVDVQLDFANSGDLSIGATASAAGQSGSAHANLNAGIIQRGVTSGFVSGTIFEQAADVPQAVHVALGNTGTITIDANANASGDQGNARATIDVAIAQTASAAGAAEVDYDNANAASISISAIGSVAGAGEASARANGFEQFAHGTAGKATFVNDGPIAVGAHADAEATGGVAQAIAGATGLQQIVTGMTAAVASNSNNGDFSVMGLANAHASSARASASVNFAVSQFAQVTQTGDALAALVNSGSINALASAKATSTGNHSAFASASIDMGIEQRAEANDGNASATLGNSGSLLVAAHATAVGPAHAGATASLSTAIFQLASAVDGNATLSLANVGTIAFDALAKATGSDADARATGFGIFQVASADSGSATIAVQNEGSLSLSVHATANGTLAASAEASGRELLFQNPSAEGGNAAANFDNSGIFALNVTALAKGVEANATAFASEAIFQSASASGAGGATVSLTNAVTGTGAAASPGVINVLAMAAATGDTSAAAQATARTDIFQKAQAEAGAASAAIDNEGTIEIDAVAVAKGSGNASASALVSAAIEQFADAGATSQENNAVGAATIALDNSGSIDVEAIAKAVASTAHANADLQRGIFQQGTASGSHDASLSLANEGALKLAAIASATGLAFAQATASLGSDVAIQQHASGVADSAPEFRESVGAGSEASAAILNDGSIVIGVEASAEADGEAHARAGNSDGSGVIWQHVSADAGNASASLVNSGTIDVMMLAQANAADGEADAAAQLRGQFQTAIAEGNASANFTNSGTVKYLAAAQATAVASANATASLATAIFQAAGASGLGSATIDNSGTIDLGAVANAKGRSGDANASINAAIFQTLQAFGESANASIFNAPAATGEAGPSGVISIVGMAEASGASANANADISTGIFQGASAAMGVSLAADPTRNAKALIQNEGSIVIGALAGASGGNADANAHVNEAIEQSARAVGGDALARFLNAAAIHVSALATASGEGFGEASARISDAIHQQAGAGSAGVAAAFIDNIGTIAIAAGAKATASSRNAVASATIHTAVHQAARGLDSLASIGNSGTIVIGADASAVGGQAGQAHAHISSAIHQESALSIALENEGMLSIAGIAAASAESFALATAEVAGIVQTASGNGADVELENTGTLQVAAIANASGQTGAVAVASLEQGISQIATSTNGSAAVTLANSGSITLAARANAVAVSGAAEADATVLTGIRQDATAAAAPIAKLENSGTLDIAALATAAAETSARAFAEAFGISQTADGGTAMLTNAATISVKVVAKASAAAGSANATASANGVRVETPGGKAAFQNSGTFSVMAAAKAEGTAGSASATAIGYSARGFSEAASYTLAIANSGTLAVAASADGIDSASANAVGIIAQAAGDDDPASVAALGGTVDNSGSLSVVAKAAGATVTAVSGTGTTAQTFIEAQSGAAATGIVLDSGTNTVTLSNSGSINVDAITANGDKATDPNAGRNASAVGIRITGNGTGGSPAPTDIVTINNSGDIIVRVSGDGGKTFRRGVAIDVGGAPSNSIINLLGGSHVYGDIDVQAGDVINVLHGETDFNGVINPECAPGSFDGAASGCGKGSLNIAADGNLVLLDPRVTGPANSYDGPSIAFVNAFNEAKGGTLTLDLEPASGGSQAIGTYSQIFADTASISGNLVARVKTDNGLFADNYFWNNVIDANTLTGKFDSCATGEGKLLLKIECSYDTGGNVDLTLTRIAFNNVFGLTRNERSVATGIEADYDPTLTGSFAALVAQLFTLDGGPTYAAALNELTAAGYAGYLQSFGSLGVHYNDALERATDCEIPALAGSVLECRTGPIRVWGQLDYQYRKGDGDVELAASKADRHSFLAGIDANVGRNAILGASIGKVDNDIDFRSPFGKVDSNGYQFGLYGVFDPGAFYVKAEGTYSSYNGHARRSVDWTALDPGLTLKGSIEGDPDVKLWTLGIHAGARLPTGAQSVLTPYIGYDYTDAKLDGFAEHGLDGANFKVFGGEAKHSWASAGVKWSAKMGGIVPTLDIGYRHMFGGKRDSFSAAFLGEEQGRFDIISAAQKSDYVLGGFSVGGKLGIVDLRIGYEGAYNGSVQEHSGFLKAVLPLGAHSARAPVAVPPSSPPPPTPVVEAPATQTCSDGTVMLAADTCPIPPAAPPAPVIGPERG